MDYRDLQRLVADPDALQQRLAERLDPMDAPDEPLEKKMRPAAVLKPIVMVRDRPSFLFLKRPETMREHSGQIAFPGGRLDPGETFDQAALREAQEELGLDPVWARPLGRVPGIPTITNYWVSPIVGWYDLEPEIVPNPAEVEEYFYAPLDDLLDPTIYDGRPVTWKGREGFIDYFNFRTPEGDSKIIWGATGRMLHQFFERVLDWKPPGLEKVAKK